MDKAIIKIHIIIFTMIISICGSQIMTQTNINSSRPSMEEIEMASFDKKNNFDRGEHVILKTDGNYVFGEVDAPNFTSNGIEYYVIPQQQSKVGMLPIMSGVAPAGSTSLFSKSYRPEEIGKIQKK